MTNEQRVKESFPKEIADHVVTVLREDGLYRHYRCQQPGTWHMGFDVVTWPGFLCYYGDMGSFLFERTEDMIAFMRGSAMSFGYAAEKCVAACRDGTEEFTAAAFNAALSRCVAESEGSVRVFEKCAELRHQGQYDSPHHASQALYDSGLFDGGDMPDCTEYTMRFLWCLHAIDWFIKKLDAGEAQRPAKAVNNGQ